MALKESLTQKGDQVEHSFGSGEQSMTVNLTMEALSKLVLDAVRAAKEPDEATKQKAVDEEQQRQDHMAAMLQEAILSERNKANDQKRCRHQKPDQSSTVYGQIHSDGLIHPICVRCQKMWTPYAPPAELVTGMGF